MIIGKELFMLDRSAPPDPSALIGYLGIAAPLWKSLIAMTGERSVDVVETWHFAGERTGWSLRMVENGRILVYLTPGEQQVQVGLVLGAKAVASAREAGLSEAAGRILDAAPKYAEGYGVRFVVRTAEDIKPFPQLLAIKCSVPAKAPARSNRSLRARR